MAAPVQFKVCGLTTLADADAAAQSGASALGFIFYPPSPRAISLVHFASLAPRLPAKRKVAVTVEPTKEELAALAQAGFEIFQIHFRHDQPPERIKSWSEAVGESRLWLAPKLPPGVDLPPAWLPFARTFMLDTFQSDVFGGSGRTGDWAKFSRHHQGHPEKTWILAGGLNPENIAEALRQSGAQVVDVNSGVEAAAGVKDHDKLKAFAAALSQSAQRLS